MKKQILKHIKVFISLVLVMSLLVSCDKTAETFVPVEPSASTTEHITEEYTTTETTTAESTTEETTTDESTTEESSKETTTKKKTETTTKVTTTKAPETTEPLNLTPLERIVKTSAEKYGAVGVQVAVISGGQVSDTTEYGWAVLNERSMTEDTKIRVASLSKTVVGMVAFRLIEQGKLDLNTDISDYIGVQVRNPDYPDTVITLKMLLTHTSGLTDANYVSSLEDLQNHFLTEDAYTNNKPGEKYVYNNFAFGVIGTICEIVTGKSLTTLAKQYFFNPMGITATYVPAQLNSSQLAVLYWTNDTIGRSISAQKNNASFTETPGKSMKLYAGGLTISAKDYARVLTLFMNGGAYNGNQLLSQSSISQMHTVQLIQPESGAGQCMPMFKRNSLYGQTLYYHTGSAYGAYTLYTYNPEKKIGVVVVTTGASSKKDNSGIYAVCGDIVRSVYEQNLV